jgi:hypothetical protein
LNAPVRERLWLRRAAFAALTFLPAMFFAAGGAPTAQFPSCPGIAGVSMWRGAVSFSYGHQLQDSVARLDLSQSASGVGVLTQAPGGPFWSGSTRGTATIHDRYVEFAQPPAQDEETFVDGAGGTIETSMGLPTSQIALTIDPVACTYGFTYSPALDIIGSKNDGSPPVNMPLAGVGSAQGFGLQIPPYDAGDPIPVLQGTGAFPAHTTLFPGTGSRYLPFDAILPFLFLGTVTENNLSSANVVWSFDPEELELVVDPKNYDTWLPEGVDQFDPATGTVVENAIGSSIDVEATVRRKSDGLPPANSTVQSIEFQLVQSSAEPGIALNAPPRSMLASPQPNDLQFDPARNAALRPSVVVPASDTSRGVASQGVGNTATAEVSAYDWGAFGELEVTATLDSGYVLKGHLITDPTVERILLPKRDASSHIGDEWKRLYGVTGLPDSEDSEDNPGGSGQDLGDGLTLYEEYRGFFNGELHPLRRGSAFANEGTNPNKKDLFVRNAYGPIIERGLKMLEFHGGVNVHYSLTETEIEPTNVVNFNHDQGAHAVDQHGIRVVKRKQKGLAGFAVPLDPTAMWRLLPRSTFHTRITPTGNLDRLLSTVAHEVGHAISVMHHGEDDQGLVTWAFDPATGQVTEDGAPIEIRHESSFACGSGGCLFTAAEAAALFSVPRATRSVYVGNERGQHSGRDDCFMRYDAASAYAHDAFPGVRWWVGSEDPGFGMDATPNGSGVNAPGRQPRARYGDACAADSRGDCRHQIRVNDKLPDRPFTGTAGPCP